MVVTNEMGLPKAFELAVKTERHNKAGCYSATTLLHGAKETILSERHYEEMTTDVADNVWAIWGTAVHSIFEKVNDETFKEIELSAEVLHSTVTGRCDSYDMENEILVDWKTASTWKVIYKDFEDWHKQGLIYAWLLNKQGLNVKKCQFIALLKDHSKSKAKIDPAYPQKPVFIYEYEVTEKDLEDIEDFIYGKIEELENASKLADDEIKECSCGERWATDEKWALMKNGRKSALKLFDTEEEAEKHKPIYKADYIEYRKGENKKCSEYCPCAEFCHFYNMNK
ncbi:MAG: PD-(D/E)XK nuclease family protein [Treponema sp.]|nr:PD-(D/E)XK nuclease family protein [Treponema sp.]